MSINRLDLTKHGYEIIERLGENRHAGRVTYKARAIEDGREVAIKPFRFFSGDNWSDYKAIEREMETLKRLLHRGIPRYEGYFDSGEGICLVQEYIDAKPLSKLDLY